MRNSVLVVIGFLFLLPALSFAQHQEINDKPEIWKEKKTGDLDTLSLFSAFARGTTHGNFRYFFMATDNHSGLTDYYANAAGGGLRFETANFHGFRMAISGFYIFNIGSSDLDKPDPSTGQSSRYEIGLFDLEDPHNKRDNDRLEELYLYYQRRNSMIRFGRQLINTPFFNLQDGRMRPTDVEGVWINQSLGNKLKVEGGWLYSISPRSTTRWFRLDESIGVYASGVGVNGQKSDYAGNLDSKGSAVLGLTYSPNKTIKMQLWNKYTERIFNSAFVQIEHEQNTTRSNVIYAGVQAMRQDALGDGGNADPFKTYFQKHGKSMTFGGRIGLRTVSNDLSLNYTRITKDGRYLMPREWGRDPFFTFLPRERNEGLGDVHAITLKWNHQMHNKAWKLGVGGGYFDLPEVTDFRLNKYGMPSYAQLNIDVRYQFKGLLKGLDTQFLVVGKYKLGDTYENDKYEFNKVNMVLYNLVMNYHF